MAKEQINMFWETAVGAKKNEGVGTKSWEFSVFSVFNVGSQTHTDYTKEQRAGSQDLEIVENDSKWVSKVRICYDSENHRAGSHQAYKQRTICKEKQGTGWFTHYFALKALKCLHLRNLNNLCYVEEGRWYSC